MIEAVHLHKLGKLCHKLGGSLVVLPIAAFNGLFPIVSQDPRPLVKRPLSESPSTGGHGINWPKKIVYATEDQACVNAIIHEMGHVFADRYHPDHSKANEYAWLGWEIVVARMLGVLGIWSKENGTYQVETGEVRGDWGHLLPWERRSIAEDRIKHALKIKVVTAAGKPRSVR